MEYNIQNYIDAVQNNFKAAKNTLVNNPQACAGAIRTALEVAVKLFWVKKYDKEPVWIINGQERFSLLRATQDGRFKCYFNPMEVAYIHGIRQTCDAILHQGNALSVAIAKELFENLEKSLKAIQEKIGEDLIVDFQKALQTTTEPKNKSNAKIVLPNPLIRDINKSWGTNAQKIYDAGCETFGWDKSKRHLFGFKQILYAEGATIEGYSPWVLPHNNWTKTVGGNWFNVINSDGTLIEELWERQKIGLHEDYTKRVTFVKMGKEYIFLGIFEPIKVETKKIKDDLIKNNKVVKKAGENVWVKTYKLISNRYPL